MILAAFSPVGVSLQTAAGLPRLRPYIDGKPPAEAVAAADRGECVLGGCCCVSPITPRWALVW
jgi:hypothetical protein